MKTDDAPIQCCAQVGIGPQQPCPRKTQQSSTSLTGQLAVTIRQLPSCIVQPCHLPNKTGMVCQFDSNLPGFGILNLAGFKFYSFVLTRSHALVMELIDRDELTQLNALRACFLFAQGVLIF